mgnify:CR=1 FL=1
MKNNIYVLNQRQDETFDAAGKAMRDVFSVLADKKAKIIWSVPKHCSKYLKLLDLPYLVLFLLFCVKKSDSVFYSIPENHLKIRLLKRLQLLKKYRIICFINDLNAFRYDGQNDGDPGEVRALAAADKILAPNVNTVSMLKKNGISSDMIPVGIWDYRMNETQIAKIREISHAHKKENEVKVSLRSKNYVDVSKLAQSFNGGGHIRAAGCTIYSSIEDAKKKIVEAVVKAVQGEKYE